jgi:subtilisin family serine protease
MGMPVTRWRPIGRLTAALAVTALSVGLIMASAPAGFSANGRSVASPKIDVAVQKQLDTSGRATVWVMFARSADLTAAPAIRDWNRRGQYVYDALSNTARTSQASLRAYLDARGVAYTSYWVVNTIKVTGDRSLVNTLAARTDVSRVRLDSHLTIETPKASAVAPDTVEWNIDRINAPDVWSTFGDRGQGIVVANVDTGVQYNHPALVRQYRGRTSSGFRHEYSWWDPTGICGDTPCDNVEHGTHTMGTMVGEDASLTNQIGVAPRAKWIAAKGCESTFCSDEALLSAGQFITAPTDLDGNNPRPNRRPHIVNNSWGGGGGDTFYQGIVNSWVAAGIWPAFSNGNSGPSCTTSGSPGDFLNTYSAGAFDINNTIAVFSSRGPSLFGQEIKPNIAAPGVAVRSSVPNNSYALLDGTSMASPHVAGTVALIWSEVPSLKGDIDTTRQILDDSAIDTASGQCGGTTDDNNVWGEGRLDAFAAVSLATALRKEG